MALIKIDLTEQLGEGQYVEILDPKNLPWKEQKKLQTIMKDDSMESIASFAEQLAITLASNGNVFDWKGNVVAFPLNTESVAEIPAVVIDEIAKKYTEFRTKGADVPKKS